RRSEDPRSGNWRELLRLVLLGEEQTDLEARISYKKKAMALTDGTAEDERVHLRGSYKKLGEVVRRRLPEALFGSTWPLTLGSGRLTFAKQMVDPSNALLPRVLVN